MKMKSESVISASVLYSPGMSSDEVFLAHTLYSKCKLSPKLSLLDPFQYAPLENFQMAHVKTVDFIGHTGVRYLPPATNEGSTDIYAQTYFCDHISQ